VKEIKAIIPPERFYAVLIALRSLPGIPGFTTTEVRGFPKGHADPGSPSHGIDAVDSVALIKIECVVPEEKASLVVEAITQAAHTGNPGDGNIFVYDVRDAIKIRTGQRGEEAI
jgi:nitrogen regulatory protein P-II 1